LREELTSPTSLMELKGVGYHIFKSLKNLGINNIIELFYYFPKKHIDRSSIKMIEEIRIGDYVTIIGKVKDIYVSRGRKKIGNVLLSDGTGFITLKWFNQEWVKKYFSIDDVVSVSGYVSFFKGLQIINPEYEKMEKEDYEAIHTGRIVPYYKLNKDITQKKMRRIIYEAIQDFISLVDDPIHEMYLKNHMSIKEAITNIHFPEDSEKLKRSLKRLAFDEILHLQIYLASLKKGFMRKNGIPMKVDIDLKKKFIESLPFKLTNAQMRVIKEIESDLMKPQPMQRLLQGDVGSGKTIVAIVSSLIVAGNGYNVAMMVPTEILAYQHWSVFNELLKNIDVNIFFVSSNVKKKEKEEIISRLKEKPSIIIGTHSLIQEDFMIPKLGLVIMDEHHRFGVIQRKTLIEKGDSPHSLFLTATPIPRTLAISVYGDLDISIIDELPFKRNTITRWVKEGKRDKVYNFVKEKMKEGYGAFIVLPLIEESEKIRLRAVKKMFEELKRTYFKDINIGILYGSMKPEEKENVIREFREKKIMGLVTTTVIEVGIDIPHGNIMVVEHADRFGLSQLHQLRGRIGRKGSKSYFILITDENITEDAIKRLEAIEKTMDGFELSEIDLKIRGPGEFFGTKQHGFSDFLIFNIFRDKELIEPAKRLAERIINDGKERLIYEFLNRIYKKGDLIDFA